MKKLRYFKDVEAAISSVGNLVTEDSDSHIDRQILANFYNGRELMTESEAEDENISTIVNHLFGYNDLNGFKLQLANIYNGGDVLWNLEIEGPPETVPDRQEHQLQMSAAIDTAIKRSRRFKPEYNATCGDLVLHGRGVLMYRDNYDWCPQLSHLYVPKNTAPVARAVPYAFAADDIPYSTLQEHLRHAKANPDSTKWNVSELSRLVEYLEENGHLSTSAQTDTFGGEHKQQAENTDEQMGTDESTALEVPVWYVYEVDHTDPLLPVDLRIITRYNITDAANNENTKIPENFLLFDEEHHFAQAEHWLHPFFMDVEIGGKPSWHSATGIGQLNYERDTDVEEFFNLAMDGAKDKMRQKWKILDGASRDKIQRFFHEKTDLVPEGVEAVELKSDPGYQHSFQIIQMLRQLSSEESGSGTQNQGTKSDELEIQASERQQRMGFQVSARIEDIYDCMDDLGSEIVRRFINIVLDEERTGFREINEFREEMKGRQIPYEEYGKQNDHGRMPLIQVKTSRSSGDGSETQKSQTNQALMSWIGLFGPEAQELIKRKVVRDITRDPDFAKAIVPFEKKPDPDQVARARTENTAAIERGITGFVPERSKDDVDGVHMPEHQNALQAFVLKGRTKTFFDEGEAKGFEALATHQMVHVKSAAGADQTKEMSNKFMQELQQLTREAEALKKQGEQQKEKEKIDPVKAQELQLKRETLDFQKQQQMDLVEDRGRRAGLDERTQSEKSQIDIEKAAQSGVEALAPL